VKKCPRQQIEDKESATIAKTKMIEQALINVGSILSGSYN